MKKLLIAFVLVLASNLIFAQNTTYQGVVEEFFKLYEENGPNEAVDFIFSTNKYLESNTDQVTAIKLKLGTAVAVIGEYSGYEPVIVKEIGQSMVQGTYMVKYARQPLFFTFIMYKPDKYWQIQTLRFDDKLTDEQIDRFENKAE
ncbi:MAG: hypothetical protein C0592_02600 [Marinilabiliales bacterium]|nr:MAG: hypothetical protein C0592_02600 [Marinilabiliales bacterium]